MTIAITTKPGKKYASIKNPRVYEALRRQGMSKQRAARISNAQAHKDADADAGAPLHGPGGLLATPGMGSRRRWGNRKRLKSCTCGVNIATKEQIAPGITRIRGNLCNVHGRYGPCNASQSGKKKPKAGKGRAAAKPKLTPEQRQQQRQATSAAQRDTNRQNVRQAMADSDQGLAPKGFDNLMALGDGTEPDEAGANALVAQGVAERGTDGHLRLTAAGRQAIGAANRGDTKGAVDAISRGHDQTQARTERQAAAAQRKQEVAQRRAEAESKRKQREAERAKKKPKGGGGSQSQAAPSGTDDTHASRERERQADRAQRQWEHAADRAQRQREHAEDRARAQREHEEDRAARQQPTPQRQTAQRAPRSPGAPIVYGNQRAHRRGNATRTKTASSFAVFKSADGAYRWIARTTTAYRDRDGEIITMKALEADAARMTATGQFGPLRYWHIGEPDPFNMTTPWGPGLDIGDCDYSIVIGRTSIESGTFKSAAIGQAYAESADDYEISPGFFHPPNQPNAAGEYDDIRRFERSSVPVDYGRASNLFTGLTVKGEHMDQATYDARVKAFTADMNKKGVPPEVAAQALAGMQQADKSAQQQGIAYKSDDAPAADPWQAVVTALKAALIPAEKAPPMDAEDDPALGGDMGVDEAAEGEPPLDDAGAGQYIGDMTPAEFWAQLQQYLAPVLKMQEMHKAIGDMVGELKGMGAAYATKDDSRATEIATLKARLAKLEGDQPAVTLSPEVEAALKSGGPQVPPDPGAPQIPNDPARPMAGLTAAVLPQLYGPQVQGYTPANGWQIAPPPPNTGGN